MFRDIDDMRRFDYSSPLDDCFAEKIELERKLAVALGLLASCQLPARAQPVREGGGGQRDLVEPGHPAVLYQVRRKISLVKVCSLKREIFCSLF